MTDYEYMLVEVRSAISRYMVKSGLDAYAVSRQVIRDLDKTEWALLLKEWAERNEKLKQIQEEHRKVRAVNRDARIVYTQCLRAKNAGVAHSLTVEQWKVAIQYFNSLCAYCQERSYEVLEHFLSIPYGGTTADNCVPACTSCNNKKNKHTPSELVAYFPRENLQRIYEFLASQKTHTITT